MALQCTRAAGHWKVGRGVRGAWEVGGMGRTRVQDNPLLTVVRARFTEGGIYVERGEGTWPRSHTGV